MDQGALYFQFSRGCLPQVVATLFELGLGPAVGVLGTLVFVQDFEEDFHEGIEYLVNLKNKNKLIFKETIVDGFENAPSAFLKLFSGENFGKLLIKV